MSVSGASDSSQSDERRDVAPEKSSAIWTRRLIIAAFWAVAVFLGLPHWTWTTSIRRSTLPLDTMNAWAEGKACQLQYPLHIKLQTPQLQDDQANALASNLENLLRQDHKSRVHTYHVHSGAGSTDNFTDYALTISLESAATAATAATPEFKLRSWKSLLEVQYHLDSQSSLTNLAGHLAPQILGIFEDENASIWHLLKDTPYAKDVTPINLSAEKVIGFEKRTTRSFKYASTYHLTFSMFTPSATPSAWNIDQAVQDYIAPLVAHLSAISEFTIDTQVQLYASFSPSIAGPVFDESKKHWTLSHSDLTGFVNAAEWPLSPSIGSGPTINFVLYVPAPDRRPLVVEDNERTSWIIPQWGGVQIHNRPSQSNVLTLEDLQADMLVFADQLATLLGLPQSPQSLSLRISSLTRERATALILSASSTLGALSRLTLKLTSIAIPDTVATAVDETLLRLGKACEDLRQGRYVEAVESARIAEAEVEKAFFEPSMVGQVYFPEEHKVAVYVPLLGPMAVPLIMSGIKEIKKLRERKVKTT